MASGLDLIEAISGDVRFLRERWDQTIDETSLRVTSGLLRRLLVEGQLQRAWKAAGFEKEPMITASSLSQVLASIERPDKLVFAAAGGARSNGVEIRGVAVWGYAMTEKEIQARNQAGPPEATTGLRAFTEAPCMVIRGRQIPRRVLIKYVANKLGGVHFDPKRSGDDDAPLYVRLDAMHRGGLQVKVADKSVIYHELLSIGQAIAGAENMTRFLIRSDELLRAR